MFIERKQQMRLAVFFIINDLGSLIMPAHPCAGSKLRTKKSTWKSGYFPAYIFICTLNYFVPKTDLYQEKMIADLSS